MIYRRIKNIRAVQLLLGHTRVENSVWFLRIQIEAVLELSEQVDI